MNQKSLFDGATITPSLDDQRLSTNQGKVYSYMATHNWVQLSELARATGGSEAGVSARLRDLRKPWWGEHEIVTQRTGDGLFSYRMIGTKPLLDGRRPHNPKPAARKRIEDFIRERDLNPHAGDMITGANGYMLRMSDLKKMMQ